MRRDLRAMGNKLAKYGRGPDTLVAHITPREAGLLKRLGGAGTTNPVTGLLEFRPGGPGNDPGAPGSASGVGGDPSGADPFGGGRGDFDAEAAAAQANAVAAAQADAQAAENAGIGGMSGAQAAGATANVNRPTMNQINRQRAYSEIAAKANPAAATAVGILGSMGLGIAAPGLGMATNALDQVGPSMAGMGGLSPFGAQGDEPVDPGGGEGPAPGIMGGGYGGLSDQPAMGLMDYSFAYTDPLTGQVANYGGGLLPWMA